MIVILSWKRLKIKVLDHLLDRCVHVVRKKNLLPRTDDSAHCFEIMLHLKPNTLNRPSMAMKGLASPMSHHLACLLRWLKILIEIHYCFLLMEYQKREHSCTSHKRLIVTQHVLPERSCSSCCAAGRATITIHIPHCAVGGSEGRVLWYMLQGVRIV